MFFYFYLFAFFPISTLIFVVEGHYIKLACLHYITFTTSYPLELFLLFLPHFLLTFLLGKKIAHGLFWVLIIMQVVINRTKIRLYLDCLVWVQSLYQCGRMID